MSTSISASVHPSYKSSGFVQPSNVVSDVSPYMTLADNMDKMHQEENGNQYRYSTFTTDNDPDMRASKGTPATDLDSEANKPDITVLCRQCHQYIDLRSLNYHRYYHKALKVMKYKDRVRPESVDKLMNRRRGLLKRLKAKTDSQHPLDTKELQIINDAYEFLKADLEQTFEELREIRENMNLDVNALALNCSPRCAFAVGMCCDQNQRWKNTMEDRSVYQDCYGNDPTKCFLGVYDGHHGYFSADMAATELHNALLIEMEKFDTATKPNIPCSEDSYCTVGDKGVAYSRKSSAMSNRSRESTVMLEQIIKSAEEKQSAVKYGNNLSVHMTQNSGNDKIKGVDNKMTTRNAKKRKDPFKENISVAFRRAHEYTDKLLEWGKDESSRVRWSGCSTLTCIIQETGALQTDSKENQVVGIINNGERNGGAEPIQELGVVHLANAGNVKCVLVRANKPYTLSKDHTPNNQKELSRITKAGGTISESTRELRVNGIVRATRGLGNHGDPRLKKCIINEPYTTTVPIDQYAQFMILATHGIWEVFSMQEAASLLTEMLPENLRSAPSAMSESVERLLAKLKINARSRIQSAATLSVNSAHDLARRQCTSSTASGTDLHSTKVFFREASTPFEGKTIPVSLNSSYPKPVGAHRQEGDHTSMTADVQSDDGSRMDNLSDLDDGDDLDEEGDDEDTDAMMQNISLQDSRISATITREEIHREFARAMAERLVHAALLAGAKDNISVMIVLLPGCGL